MTIQTEQAIPDITNTLAPLTTEIKNKYKDIQNKKEQEQNTTIDETTFFELQKNFLSKVTDILTKYETNIAIENEQEVSHKPISREIQSKMYDAFALREGVYQIEFLPLIFVYEDQFDTPYTEIIQFLINGGFVRNINDQDSKGNTVLMRAIKNSQDDLAKLIIAKDNVNINHKNNSDHTPLTYALLHGRTDIAKTLLTQGANLDGILECSPGFNNLQSTQIPERSKIIIKKEIVKKDIENTLDPLITQVRSENNSTTVQKVFFSEITDILNKYTPEIKAELEKTYDTITPINDFVMSYMQKVNIHSLRDFFINNKSEKLYPEIIKFILNKYPNNINDVDEEGNTALMKAIQNSHDDLAEFVMGKNNVNINHENNFSHTPLTFALLYGRTDIANALIDKDATVDGISQNDLSFPNHLLKYIDSTPHVIAAHLRLLYINKISNLPQQLTLFKLYETLNTAMAKFTSFVNKYDDHCANDRPFQPFIQLLEGCTTNTTDASLLIYIQNRCSNNISFLTKSYNNILKCQNKNFPISSIHNSVVMIKSILTIAEKYLELNVRHDVIAYADLIMLIHTIHAQNDNLLNELKPQLRNTVNNICDNEKLCEALEGTNTLGAIIKYYPQVEKILIKESLKCAIASSDEDDLKLAFEDLQNYNAAVFSNAVKEKILACTMSRNDLSDEELKESFKTIVQEINVQLETERLQRINSPQEELIEDEGSFIQAGQQNAQFNNNVGYVIQEFSTQNGVTVSMTRRVGGTQSSEEEQTRGEGMLLFDVEGDFGATFSDNQALFASMNDGSNDNSYNYSDSKLDVSDDEDITKEADIKKKIKPNLPKTWWDKCVDFCVSIYDFFGNAFHKFFVFLGLMADTGKDTYDIKQLDYQKIDEDNENITASQEGSQNIKVSEDQVEAY